MARTILWFAPPASPLCPKDNSRVVSMKYFIFRKCTSKYPPLHKLSDNVEQAVDNFVRECWVTPPEEQKPMPQNAGGADNDTDFGQGVAKKKRRWEIFQSSLFHPWKAKSQSAVSLYKPPLPKAPNPLSIGNMNPCQLLTFPELSYPFNDQKSKQESTKHSKASKVNNKTINYPHQQWYSQCPTPQMTAPSLILKVSSMWVSHNECPQ